MAGPFDFTGQNIEDSYQRVLQTDGTLVYDGTGSLFTITSASYALTASFAVNGGVTQLLAGPNITLSPTNGKGQVTVSSTAGGGGFNTSTGSYGSFYDTTTQTNPVGNVPRSMSFNSTDITNGVSISGSTSPFNTYIKTENAGVYDIQFSAQVEKTDSGTDEIIIWLRKNGIDLIDTATTLTLVGNSTKVVAAWNWFVNSAANDYYQIIWISVDTSMRLLAEPISGTHPGIPSVILTANRVDQFLSNTGSFSGSFNGEFTGSLLGTSSWANNALTASFVNSASTNAFVQGGNSFGAQALLGTNDNQSLAFETSGSTRMFISSSGNVGIGTASPSSSILLDVSGSIRSFNILPAANGSYDLGVSANRFRNGWFAGSLIAGTGYFSNLFFGVTNLGIYNSTSTQIAQMFGTGDLVLQSGGTFTNNNYRLQVNATGSTNSGSLFLGGTTIATGSIARTMLISSSLSASANNDVLVGLDIAPTFTPGAFTGVQQENLVIRGNTNPIIRFKNQAGNTTWGQITANASELSFNAGGGSLNFTAGNTIGMYMFTATRNVLIQNGGTFTDRGYRLDVSGSGNFAANLTVTGSTTLHNGQTTIQGAGATSTTTALLVRNSTPTNIITVLNNGVVGINRTPTASLDIAGTTRLSGSFNTAASGSILTVIGSGSTQPIFTVQGSQGELFSITDSLTGSLFSVNDISGLPILEVFSDGTTLIGDYQDPALITTTRKTANTGVTTIYSLPTASYDGAWFDYTIRSGSDARVGTIMGMWSGSSINYTETSASQFGTTSGFTFGMSISGSNMILSGSATTSGWTVKTIIRSI